MADTPKVRFKGFTDAWEQRKLGEIIQTLPYKEYIRTPEQNGKYEIIQQGNEPIIGFADGTPCSDYKDTVIFGDHTLSLYKPNRPFFVATDGVRIVKGKQYIDGFFLMTMLEKYKPQSEGYKRYYSILAYSDCCFTEYDEEQCKIGELFKRLDNLVTLHERKCDETKELKKYMLQKMFPQSGKKIPEIRFAGFTSDWEQRKLGEIAERVTRKNQDLESELPLTISAQYGLIDQNEFFDKRVASKDVSGYFLVRNGEFAYNKSTSSDAPWGAVKRLERYEKGVLSTLYIVFRIIDESKTASDYIVTYYDTDLWHKGVQAIAAEGARNHGLLNIATSDFFETTLMIPKDIDEQNRIGSYFKTLDHLITLHQRKCDQLKEVKKFMLQNMFPQKG